MELEVGPTSKRRWKLIGCTALSLVSACSITVKDTRFRRCPSNARTNGCKRTCDLSGFGVVGSCQVVVVAFGRAFAFPRLCARTHPIGQFSLELLGGPVVAPTPRAWHR